MATNKTILNRINTVSLTKQITQTMKMVAASSLEKKKQQFQSIEAYYSSLQELLHHVLPSLSQLESPYTDSRKVKKILLVALTTDKGLCGSFINSVLGGMMDTYQALEGENKKVILLPIGKKGITFCQQNSLPYLGIYKSGAKRNLTELVNDLSDFLLNAFKDAVYDEVRCIYQSHPIGPNRKNITVEQLLPITLGNTPSTPLPYTDLTIYEPDPLTVYQTLIPQIIRTTLFRIISVSQFTEQKARMMAMHQATDNADSLLKELKHLYNRTRQASITTEINEINAGANSMQ